MGVVFSGCGLCVQNFMTTLEGKSVTIEAITDQANLLKANDGEKKNGTSDVESRWVGPDTPMTTTPICNCIPYLTTPISISSHLTHRFRVG